MIGRIRSKLLGLYVTLQALAVAAYNERRAEQGGWVVMAEDPVHGLDWHATYGGAAFYMNPETGRFRYRDHAREYCNARNAGTPGTPPGTLYYVIHESLLNRVLPKTIN